MGIQVKDLGEGDVPALDINGNAGFIRAQRSQFLSDLGIDPSYSRPYTPDDNPFSEAHFKTMKYRPDYPDRFASKEQALTWARAFFPWYNHQHHHIGLGLLTPASVHLAQATNILAQRQTTLDAAYARHPDRFVHGSPAPPPLPIAVWINPPIHHDPDARNTP